MNLPHHRRYNWTLVWRSYRHLFAWFVLIAILIALMLAGEQYLIEHNLRLSAENKLLDERHQAYALATIGAPGYTKTDWKEGTTELEVRKP